MIHDTQTDLYFVFVEVGTIKLCINTSIFTLINRLLTSVNFFSKILKYCFNYKQDERE